MLFRRITFGFLQVCKLLTPAVSPLPHTSDWVLLWTLLTNTPVTFTYLGATRPSVLPQHTQRRGAAYLEEDEDEEELVDHAGAQPEPPVSCNTQSAGRQAAPGRRLLASPPRRGPGHPRRLCQPRRPWQGLYKARPSSEVSPVSL